MLEKRDRQFLQSRAMILIAVGSNDHGRWGSPKETLARLPSELMLSGINPILISKIYATRPVDMPMQPDVLNAVVLAETSRGSVDVLRTLQQIERQAGRSRVKLSRQRSLDLDLVARGGRVIGAVGRRKFVSGRAAGRLILPHPVAHLRSFVLRPLVDVAPGWWHPRQGGTASLHLRRRWKSQRKREPLLDSSGNSWEDNP